LGTDSSDVFDEKLAIAQIARRLGMDGKTVRRWVRMRIPPDAGP
jgi:transposase-like protein